jgi:hypothetical protein
MLRSNKFIGRVITFNPRYPNNYPWKSLPIGIRVMGFIKRMDKHPYQKYKIAYTFIDPEVLQSGSLVETNMGWWNIPVWEIMKPRFISKERETIYRIQHNI